MVKMFLPRTFAPLKMTPHLVSSMRRALFRKIIVSPQAERFLRKSAGNPFSVSTPTNPLP